MSEALSLDQGNPPDILIVPDKRLRLKARRVVASDRDAVAGIVQTMFAAMYKAPGIGLAAPQIGLSLRVIVLDLVPDGEASPIAMINPELVKASRDTVTREEGCLSLPGLYAEVTRPASVVAAFEDAAGRKHTLEADGLLAVCIQHEIDHLDGVLFVDHLSPLKRNILLRRLAKDLRDKATPAKTAR